MNEHTIRKFDVVVNGVRLQNRSRVYCCFSTDKAGVYYFIDKGINTNRFVRSNLELMKNSFRMKVFVCILIALFGFIQVNAAAGHVKVVGEIENHKFIDRELVYSLPDLNNEVSRTFTFPRVSDYSSRNIP